MEDANEANAPLLDSSQITYTKTSVAFKWVVLIAISVLVLAVSCSFCFLVEDWTVTSTPQKIGIMLAFLPVVFFEFFFAIPVLSGHFRSWWFHMPFQPWKLFIPPAIIAVSYTIGSLFMLRFDPLGTTLIFILSLVVFANMQQDNVVLNRDFTWVDAGIWIMLWMPMDIGFRGVWLKIGSIDQWWWSCAVSVILLISWGCIHRNLELGYSVKVTLKSVITLVILLTIVILLTLPFIFLTHFVTWKPKGGNLVAFIWVQELVGVAIPQELFYRSVLLSGLVKAINRKPICIIVGSIIYALTFWSNDFSFLEQLCYFAFGIVTGILYGTAFLYSESVMPSILVHSLLDFFIIGFTNILLQF